MSKTVNIAGASGYWGESAMATPQLLNAHKSGAVKLDYIVYDYLAEITMSILARAKAKAPETAGFARDFVEAVIRPHAGDIAGTGIKLIANAGGVNPEACAREARTIIAEAGLNLKVAVITGDDRMANIDTIAASCPNDMFSGAAMPALDKIASINAYLGAFPVAKALAAGADIVITGRVVDSAVTLGACIHEFGWGEQDWDLLASGSLCGHILECGPQVTGGNFTDWELAGDVSKIGYPIAEVRSDGSFVTTKPPGTTGVVNVGTVSEQMLYEIGDPQAYLLPDVTCDFSQVSLAQIGLDRVEVSPAKGRAAPTHYKTCLTYADGFRAGLYLTFVGNRASDKAKAFADAAIARAETALRASNLGTFTEVSQEIIGNGSQMGSSVASSEIVIKIAVKHAEAKGVGMFLRELNGTYLATPPGLSAFTGAGRAKPSPVVRLFSYLTPKSDVTISIDVEGKGLTHTDTVFEKALPAVQLKFPKSVTGSLEVTIEDLAWARSGDKGNKANIGVIARKPEYIDALWTALTPARIGQIFSHFMEDMTEVKRFYLPGSNAINFLMDRSLGGGGAASLRNDAQAKGFAQILLSQQITVPSELAKAIKS
ncbi:MAG: acyclic terpene utilization AtuA family protein [Litorimonas sp.]